jgi:hypothetical protein
MVFPYTTSVCNLNLAPRSYLDEGSRVMQFSYHLDRLALSCGDATDCVISDEKTRDMESGGGRGNFSRSKILTVQPRAVSETRWLLCINRFGGGEKDTPRRRRRHGVRESRPRFEENTGRIRVFPAKGGSQSPGRIGFIEPPGGAPHWLTARWPSRTPPVRRAAKRSPKPSKVPLVATSL